MALQKIKIKNSQTLTSFLIGILIVMILFMGIFNYISDTMNINEIEFDTNGTYSTSYTKMAEAQTEMDNFNRGVESDLNDVAEADSAFSVAINGLKGLGNIVKAPIVMISTSTKVVSGVIETTTGIPSYITSIFLIGVSIVVILIIVKLMMGGNPAA